MIDPKDEDIDRRLTRLKDATESIAPSAKFLDRVMSRLDGEHTSWLRLIPSLWNRALPIAALLAMISVGWAYHKARAADVRLAMPTVADESGELDW